MPLSVHPPYTIFSKKLIFQGFSSGFVGHQLDQLNLICNEVQALFKILVGGRLFIREAPLVKKR